MLDLTTIDHRMTVENLAIKIEKAPSRYTMIL